MSKSANCNAKPNKSAKGGSKRDAAGKTKAPEVTTVSMHDPEFKNLITVPKAAVHHMPPAHLEISRLVLCRKFDVANPANSCPMGDTCKFVHVDMSCPELTTQSIHVNYAYRSLADVVHERLPAGESLSVMAPNNRAPAQQIPSDMVLATKGAVQRHSTKVALSHCAHYYFNRMCNRGDRCGFIHAVYIDENATEFQRAPSRAGAGGVLAKTAATGPSSEEVEAVNASSQGPAADVQFSEGLSDTTSVCTLGNAGSNSITEGDLQNTFMMMQADSATPTPKKGKNNNKKKPASASSPAPVAPLPPIPSYHYRSQAVSPSPPSCGGYDADYSRCDAAAYDVLPAVISVYRYNPYSLDHTTVYLGL